MEQEIIPAQNIAFAVLDDGSYIANFRKPNGGGCDPEKMMKLFQGIVKYIKECPRDELVGFSLTQIIYDANIKMTTIDRMEKMKPATEDNL